MVLERFYNKDNKGERFRRKAIPKNQNIEDIDKPTLNEALKKATEKTTKGTYKKCDHDVQLLQIINVSKVRKAAPRCERLFKMLEGEISATK